MKQVFTNKPNILLQIMSKVLFELDKEKRYQIIIEEESKKRTKTQNNYYWELNYQLASSLNTSSNELHFELLKRYSPAIVMKLPIQTDPKDYVKYYEKYKTEDGDKAVYYKVYKGSSEMNTKEFKALLEGIRSECIEVGIEVLTPSEMAQLKEN